MPTKRLLLFPLLFFFFIPLSAQDFSVEGVFQSPQKGRATLVVFDGDSSSSSFSARLTGDRCVFVGRVKRPCVAELHHRSLAAPLVFFIDNSHIVIEVNPSHPEQSRIMGSRPNSEFRILKETWDAASQSGSLQSADNLRLDAPYAPYLLYSGGSEVDMLSLFPRLSGEATQGYHYHLLQRRVERLRSLTVGERLPDFVFPDKDGRSVHLDSARCDSTYTLLFFGSSYCEQCQRVMRVLKKDNRPNLSTIFCMLDDDKRGWDAPFVEQLAIDHIPYLILLDREGAIVARDLRIWELEKMKIE